MSREWTGGGGRLKKKKNSAMKGTPASTCLHLGPASPMACQSAQTPRRRIPACQHPPPPPNPPNPHTHNTTPPPHPTPPPTPGRPALRSIQIDRDLMRRWTSGTSRAGAARCRRGCAPRPDANQIGSPRMVPPPIAAAKSARPDRHLIPGRTTPRGTRTDGRRRRHHPPGRGGGVGGGGGGQESQLASVFRHTPSTNATTHPTRKVLRGGGPTALLPQQPPPRGANAPTEQGLALDAQIAG